MSNEETGRGEYREHSLTLTDRCRMSVSGVEEVVSFDEQSVQMRTVRGLVTVQGEKLHVDSLDKQAGLLALSGHITALVYTEPRGEGGVWARLFG